MIITLLAIDIEVEEPFAIAAPEIVGALDRPVAKGPDGRPYVPATSLAGSLRAHLVNAGLDESVLGSTNPLLDADTADADTADEGGEEDDQALVPSVLRFLGSRLEAGEAELLAQTAIDRNRQAALPKSLRVGEVIPGGAKITLYGRIDGHRLVDIPGFQQALLNWSPHVGGGRTSGRGKAQLLAVRHGVIDLDTDAGRRAWLTQGGPPLVEYTAGSVLTPQPAHEPERLADVTFEIVDELLVTGPDSVDAVPLESAGRPAVTGAGIKGVLRSRAEFVLRSIGVDVCTAAPACGTCATCRWFGSTTRRGTLAVRLEAADGEPAGAVSGHRTIHRTHVAIDRVSGGARTGLLFDAKSLAGGRFRVSLELLDVLDQYDHRSVTAVIAAVLADVDEGFVGFGAGTTRGRGTLRIVRDAEQTIVPEPDHETLRALVQGRQPDA